MVVGAVRPKWVSPQIAGFIATFRFTPRARLGSEVPCDCGNLSGAVSPLMRPSAMIRQASALFHKCGELPAPVRRRLRTEVAFDFSREYIHRCISRGRDRHGYGPCFSFR